VRDNQANPSFSQGSASEGRWPRIVSHEGFSYFGTRLLFLLAVFAPLSIAVSQIVVGLLTAYWLLVQLKLGYSRSVAHTKQTSILLRPIAAWLVVALLSTLVGVDPPQAFPELLKTAFYLLIPFWVADLVLVKQPSPKDIVKLVGAVLLCFVFGQSLAALHTILEQAFLPIFPLSPPGSVTESGQLVLTLAASVGLLFQIQSTIRSAQKRSMQFFGFDAILAVCIVMAAIGVLWIDSFQLRTLGRPGIAIEALIYSAIFAVFFQAVINVIRSRSLPSETLLTPERSQLLWIMVALMVSAVLINLKRGPWFALLVQMIVFGGLLSRRTFIPAVILFILSCSLLQPVRERMLLLIDHFIISGGRLAMWSVGYDLLQRFPLGLGLDNAQYMQVIDPTLPSSHRHMHNNLLNIVVETGWIGLTAFLWWLYALFRLTRNCWQRGRNSHSISMRNLASLALAIGVGLLGWQVAGLVEYNFGDGEVRMIALAFMGLLLALAAVPEVRTGKPAEVMVLPRKNDS